MAAVTTVAGNVQRYPAPVWQWFNTTARAGTFTPTDAVGGGRVLQVRARTPATRAVLELSALCKGGRIVDARFRAYGCPTTIAVGAWLAEWCVGRDVSTLPALRATELLSALEIQEDRTHCALMGEDVAQALFAQADQEVTT